MNYAKPQLLNVKKASSTILGPKNLGGSDNGSGNSTANAYRNDE